MISRSASRTRWTMFCLAAWAAMRPNRLESSLLSSSSPNSASGSRFSLASLKVISVAGSATVSTTVLASKSSTSPISGLNCASILRWWPKVFFAAEIMAFSKALIRIDLSMPFSLLTCSMTRLRSCCISRTPVVLVIGLFNRRKRNVVPRSLLRHRDALAGNGLENAEKRSSPADQVARPYAHALADIPRKVLGPLERPVDSRRGNLQSIRPRHHVLTVEQLAQLPAHPAQIIHGRPPSLIKIQTQDAPATASFVAQLDIDDLHAFILGQRCGQFPPPTYGRIHADCRSL